ncbi:heme exporter protein B [Natronospira proteinivora]|uniref:Heme exporter protein B n=1 Tax=Natronospira proteinivora TaxID=1807133 RepID=A0ABT1G699_9GAMM|nr:heme exporter protein CcmB [Natronospira proteinivora]MCP1726819.1 heme exporter protein B [Natronospira proteinivora]
MNSVLLATFRRELLLAIRNTADVVTPLFFFLLVGLLFVLGLEPRPELLVAVGPGVVWVAALLASLLGAERLFRADFQSGALELAALSPQPLSLHVLGKLLGHWLMASLPLLLLSPLLGLMMNLPGQALSMLLLVLLLGTPVFTVLCALGAALTVSLRGGGSLLALLVLPLTIPVLIFGSRSVVQSVGGEDVTGLWALATLTMLAISLGPWAIAAALRISLE